MTTAQKTKRLEYSHTMGMTVMEGKGFYYPVDTAVGKDDRLYVISRSKEETTRGIRVTICDAESGYFGNFGGYGFGGGQFVWPACGATDSQGRFFISDERLHRVTAYDADGAYLFHWGHQGSGEGELDTPSGLAFDGQDNIYVADTYNNRVQKFTADGRFLLSISGAEPGTDAERGVSLPWGLACDAQDNVYIADFGNDAIKKFSSERRVPGLLRLLRARRRPVLPVPPRWRWTGKATSTWRIGATRGCRCWTPRATSCSFFAVRLQSPSGPPTSSASTGKRPPPAPQPTWTWK